MAGARPLIYSSVSAGPNGFQIGDTLLLGESYSAGANATVGAAVLTGAQLVTGIIARTGSTGAYTDTTDSATNIIAALAGNGYAPETLQGSSFRCRILNTVAFIETLAAGTGVILGSGVTANAASSWRDYLFTVLNPGPNYTVPATTSTSVNVTFVLAPGTFAYPIGPNPASLNISPGMTVTGSGVPASTTVLSVVMGQGGIIGITLSAATTTTLANTPLVFGPTVRVDGIGSGLI